MTGIGNMHSVFAVLGYLDGCSCYLLAGISYDDGYCSPWYDGIGLSFSFIATALFSLGI